MALRKFLVLLKGQKQYEQLAEDIELEDGSLCFWVSYRDAPFLALALPASEWLSCKEVADADDKKEEVT